MNYNKMEKYKKTAVLAAFAFFAISALPGCGKESEENADALIVNVESARVEKGSLVLQNSFMGTISPEDTVSVIPLVSGTVTEANFNVGDAVNAGDVLFRIDDTSAQLQLAQAKLGVASAQLQSSMTLGPQHDLSLLQQQASIDQLNNQIMATAIGIEQSKDAKSDYKDQKHDIKEQIEDLDSEIASLKETKSSLDAASQMFNSSISHVIDDNDTVHPDVGGTFVDGTPVGASWVNSTYVVTQKSIISGGDNDGKYDCTYELYQVAGMTREQVSSALESASSAISSMESAKTNLEASVKSVDSAIQNTDYGIESAENTMYYLYQSKGITQASNDIQNGELYKDTKNSLGIAEENAQIAVDSTELALSYYTLTAPISGIIEQKNVKENDLAATGYAAYVISNKDAMTATFSVSEDVMHTLSVGDIAAIERNGVEYTGTLSEIQDTVNPQTGLFLVKAAIPASGDCLASGVSVKISLDTYRSDDSLLIPYSCVYYDDGRAYVYLAKNGKAQKTYIKTGIFDDEKIVVTSGISEDDDIITTWSPQLADGVNINILSAQSEVAE